MLPLLWGRSGSCVMDLGEKGLLRSPSDQTLVRRAASPEVIQSLLHKCPPQAVQERGAVPVLCQTLGR